jgi:hypothetical protein
VSNSKSNGAATVEGLEAVAALADAPRPIFRPNLKKLSEESVRVQVSVQRWYGEEKLQLSDLGLELAPEAFQQFSKNFLALGKQRLMPKDYAAAFASVAESGRKLQRSYGYKWPEGGYIIPKRLFLEWLTATRAIQARWEDLVERFTDAEEYARWKSEVHDSYLIKAGFEVALRNGRSVQAAVVELDADTVAVVDKMMAAIPTAEALKRLFDFSWTVETVEMPEVLASGVNVTDLERRAAEAEKHLEYLNAQLAAEEEHIKNSEERSKSYLRIQAEQAKVQAELAAERERIATETEIRKEMLEHTARTRKAQIDETLTQAGAQVLELVWNVAEGVEDAIKDGVGKLHGNQVERLATLVSKLRAFGTICDTPEIETLAQAVADMAEDAKAAAATPHDLKGKLADLALIAKSELITLRKVSRTPLDVERLPSEVDVTLVRKARRTFNLPVAAAPAAPAAPRTRKRVTLKSAAAEDAGAGGLDRIVAAAERDAEVAA